MKGNKRLARRNIVLSVLLIIILISVAIYVFSVIKNAINPQYAPTVSQQITEVRYVLKLYNGRIAVFREGYDLPETITEISEQSLRNFDREQLALGVTVLGDVELAMRLEDYGS